MTESLAGVTGMIKRPRILVLEDEPLIAMMIVAMLDTLDCDCVGPIGHLVEGLERAKMETLAAPPPITLVVRSVPFRGNPG